MLTCSEMHRVVYMQHCLLPRTPLSYNRMERLLRHTRFEESADLPLPIGLKRFMYSTVLLNELTGASLRNYPAIRKIP